MSDKIKNTGQSGNDTIHSVIHSPNELEPVLAKIEHINDLGKSEWYEVV